MMHPAALIRNQHGAAAAEMALVTPLLLIIMCGAFEIGNYFLDEHILVKAVRDGARFAARQNFTNYSGLQRRRCRSVAHRYPQRRENGLVCGGTDRLPFWAATTISVTMTCTTTAGGQTMSGIYRGRASGAPIVTVSATVPYTPVLQQFRVSRHRPEPQRHPASSGDGHMTPALLSATSAAQARPNSHWFCRC